MQVRLLGKIQLIAKGQLVEVSAAKVRWLLATLALEAGRSCSRSSIVDSLWPNQAPATASNLVQGYVSVLRKLVGANSILTSGSGYTLVAHTENVDALKFRELVADARKLSSTDPVEARKLLAFALGLWGGTPFGQVLAEGPLAAVSAGLVELHSEAVELRVQADLELGRHQQLVPELEELVASHPYREGLLASLAVALYRSGRQVDALRRIEATRSRLSSDLGVSLGPGLARLEHQILSHAPALEEHEREAQDLSAERLVAQPSPRPGLIGRDREMARLDDRLGSVVNGAQRTVFVGGEPGIGKSTVAFALGDQASHSGYQVLVGRCDEYVAAPYRPFVEVAIEALRRLGTDSASELVGPRRAAVLEVLPSAGALLAAPAETYQVAGSATSMSLLDRFDTWCWLLQEIAGPAPTVLVLEDVHWADSATIRLLHFVASGHRLPGVLLLATHRTTEPAELLDDVLADLRSEPQVERMRLVGLDQADLAEVLTAQLGSAGDTDFADWVYAQTDGNPFLAVEVARHVAATGSRVEVPPSIIEVVSRRLRRLSPQAYRLLEYAAILGVGAPLGMLRALAAEVSGLAVALAEVTSNGILLTEDDEGRSYRFQHAILRAAIMHELSVFDREDLHLRAAEVWRRSHRTPEANLELASHLWAARSIAPVDESIASFTLAGDHADASGAKVEAVTWYDRALGLLGESDPRHRTVRLTRFVAAQAAWHWVHGDIVPSGTN